MATQTTTRQMILRPTSFEVSSESKPGVTYRVQLPDCDCPDFRYRRTHNPDSPFCKHLLLAFAQAGWQLPEKTEGLNYDEAVALLVRKGAGVIAARTALTRAFRGGQGLVSFGSCESVAVVEKDEDEQFTVNLPFKLR